ncbi:toxic anion resistance protein [Phocea massiliensis]|uniref:TelA-like protein n=1 Tax=uncultured Anaerotruncus sp. TaxID=905011 RepID=A0A6N2S4R8_9FIRM|nr:toxic anion resistance protein [Merdimmobilis hominis]MCD4836450.1 toxic anion resistance protein [Merdimmobilis hominis]PWL61906.1 MAG: toxic anion resistance protein [Oscillospiraceae bacterium]
MPNEKNPIELELGEAAPVLTLEPYEESSLALKPAAEEALATAPEENPDYLSESSLSPEERQMVSDFAEKIDVNNSTIVLQYGAACQKKIAAFSESALQSVRTKDLGEVGDAITDLVVELKGFSLEEEEKGGFFGLFKKATNQVEKMKARYDKAELNVEKIAGVLDGHQVQLMKDIAMLDKLYALNLTYFKELTMYILAGKKRLADVRSTTLEELKAKAQRSGLAEDAQAANDFAAMCDRFEKKLHDLELTRMVSIQMAPQIRMVQNNDALMAEKIQSTLVNTIPLWKNQMVLALGIAHSREAMEAQRAVTDMTNELLKKNADTLKMGTVEAAKESERGIVDLETLKYTNQQLISTLDEVVKIQEDGRAKRRAAEAELGRIEGELKQKLLDIRG